MLISLAYLQIMAPMSIAVSCLGGDDDAEGHERVRMAGDVQGSQISWCKSLRQDHSDFT